MKDNRLENYHMINSMDINKIVGCALYEIARSDGNSIILTADVEKRIYIADLLEHCPDQFLDVGIAEENLVGVSAGLAEQGFHCIAVSYAPFITARVLDDIKVNLSYMGAAVTLIGLASGLTGGDLGATHMCLEDIANLRTLPGMTVVSPSDGLSAYKLLIGAKKLNIPLYMRITGAGKLPAIYEPDMEFSVGKANWLRKGGDIGIIATGAILYNSLQAADKLEKKGIGCTVVDMHTIKPLDTGCIDGLRGCKAIVCIEEHSVVGGLGSAVAEYVSEQGGFPPLYRLGTQDTYFIADLRENNLKRAGLDVDSIIFFLQSIYEGKENDRKARAITE